MQDRKDWRGQGKVGDVSHLFPYKERFQEGKTCQENGVHLDSTFRLVQGMGWPVGGRVSQREPSLCTYRLSLMGIQFSHHSCPQGPPPWSPSQGLKEILLTRETRPKDHLPPTLSLPRQNPPCRLKNESLRPLLPEYRQVSSSQPSGPIDGSRRNNSQVPNAYLSSHTMWLPTKNSPELPSFHHTVKATGLSSSQWPHSPLHQMDSGP